MSVVSICCIGLGSLRSVVIPSSAVPICCIGIGSLCIDALRSFSISFTSGIERQVERAIQEPIVTCGSMAWAAMPAAWVWCWFFIRGWDFFFTSFCL